MVGMPDGYAIDPGEVTAATGTLSDLGEALRSQAGSLTVTPDAGQSSKEVASAFADLSDELRGVAQAIAGAGDALHASLMSYQGTDAQVGDTYDQLMRP